ncbi:MAG TPA: nickel-binding protein [Albitalea sp.]
MPRYLIERTFASACDLSDDADGAQRRRARVESDAAHGVIWLHSYVTPDRRRSFCIADGPSPEAIRAAADAAGLPVDRISEVRVLDPYFLT